MQSVVDGMNDTYFSLIISRDRDRIEGSADNILAVPEVRVRLQDVTSELPNPHLTFIKRLPMNGILSTSS